MSATIRCKDCNEPFEAKSTLAQRCQSCIKLHRKQYLKEYAHGKRRGNCIDCGKDIGARGTRCVPCDNHNRTTKYIGPSNPNWREGRTKSHGYIYTRVKEGTPGKGKGAFYRAEHILVWQEQHGKELPNGWVVHHLNGVKDDNRPENLLGLPRVEHHKHPREALRPYEARIKELEDYIKSNFPVMPG